MIDISMHPLSRGLRTLAVGMGVVLATSVAVHAESDVSVGGYHDQALRAAQAEWLGLSGGATDSGSAGLPPLALDTPSSSTQTSFTPRLGGLSLGFGALQAASMPAAGSLATGGTSGRQVAFGLSNTSTIAGVAVDWSAKAGVSHQPPTKAGERSSFVVGGELAVSGVRFDAAYGERSTVLGVSGNRVTAGIGYGFGPIDARISYSVVSAEDEAAASLVTVGSRLTLQPGLILQGDLAFAEEERGGDAATAGVVSLRFNF